MEFKVGDWVCCNIRVLQVTSISSGIDGKQNAIFCGQSHFPVPNPYIVLWQPKEGEWVCVDRYDDNLFTVCKFNSQFLEYKDCEPFIGELPSFLKDN